jgi:ribosomal protein S18 acetylase RimI-like enzyme
MTEFSVRAADATELDQLAQLWFDAWHESHAQLSPAALTRLRTLPSFRERLQAVLPVIRVVGPVGSPVGFCIVRDDELYQLFVAAEARGSGVATALVADAECRLRAAGVRVAWLACAVGNDRAARFYEKCGWQRVRTMTNAAETSEGPFSLEVWRFERCLT